MYLDYPAPLPMASNSIKIARCQPRTWVPKPSPRSRFPDCPAPLPTAGLRAHMKDNSVHQITSDRSPEIIHIQCSGRVRPPRTLCVCIVSGLLSEIPAKLAETCAKLPETLSKTIQYHPMPFQNHPISSNTTSFVIFYDFWMIFYDFNDF